MKKALYLLFALVITAGCFNKYEVDPIIVEIENHAVPVIEIPYYKTTIAKAGWEERGSEFIQFNSTGVRLENGSGTMVYYDAQENYMYVLTCGHLFPSGYFSSQSLKKNPRSVNVDVFYHNDKKLERFERYKGEVLCHVWQHDIHDVALLRFKPNWKDPWVTPIAPLDTKLVAGEWMHNVGCDGLSEVAHYLVKFYSMHKKAGYDEIICKNNAARGGRSGGGLIKFDEESNRNVLVGITSRSDRQYTSLYSSTKQIHDFLKKEGFSFVLTTNDLARKIPVVDRNNPQGEYSKDYIPLPTR